MSYYLFRNHSGPLDENIILLCITLITLLRKELFKKVHHFIHLNLAIALFLGYVAFVAGVDTAIVNRVCTLIYSDFK